MEPCAANGYDGDVHLHVVTVGGAQHRKWTSDGVTILRDSSPIDGHGAAGNTDARGFIGGTTHPGGTSRPGGRK